MASLSRIYRQVRDTLRYDGVLILLWKIVVKAASPFGRLGIEILFEKDLTLPLEGKRARVDIAVCEARESEVSRLVALEHGAPMDEESELSDDEEYQEALRARMRAFFSEQYLDAMRRGEKCFIAKAGEEIVHINWSRFQWAQPIPGCKFPLRPGEEVFTSDAFTPEAWRGHGVHEAVNNEMLLSAQRAGYRKAYTMTDLVKSGSRRGLLRVGWQRCGKLLYFCPRGLDRTYIMRLGGTLGPLARAAESDAGHG